MTKLKKYLLYAGLEKEEFEPLLPEVRLENGRSVRIYLGISAGVFLACLLMCLKVGGALAVNQTVYTVMVAVSIVLYVSARWLLPAHPGLSTPLSILYILSMYGYSFTVSLTHESIPATAAVAILLVMPALFTYRPIYMIAMTIAAVFVHFGLATLAKPMDVALLDLWNSLFFGTIAILLSVYLMQTKFRLLAQKRKNRMLGETDILTGARNRNCFERRRPGYADKCRDSLTCVFVDVNGLHELNDTQRGGRCHAADRGAGRHRQFRPGRYLRHRRGRVRGLLPGFQPGGRAQAHHQDGAGSEREGLQRLRGRQPANQAGIGSGRDRQAGRALYVHRETEILPKRRA